MYIWVIINLIQNPKILGTFPNLSTEIDIHIFCLKIKILKSINQFGYFMFRIVVGKKRQAKVYSYSIYLFTMWSRHFWNGIFNINISHLGFHKTFFYYPIYTCWNFRQYVNGAVENPLLHCSVIIGKGTFFSEDIVLLVGSPYFANILLSLCTEKCSGAVKCL